MKYVPKLSDKEIKEHHTHFAERISLYESKGMDFIRSRNFIIEKAKPLSGNMLEIGSGTGYTTLCLARGGYAFVSIDKDREALRTTAMNLAYENLLSKVALYVMDGCALEFQDENFDNVICVNLFHHIEDIGKILFEIDRVLSGKGKAVLADFNEEGKKIVEAVHREEGRVHTDTGVDKGAIFAYFDKMGYNIRGYEEKYHWILIAHKGRLRV